MGKGGGKAHTPREAKDNLKSTQMMRANITTKMATAKIFSMIAPPLSSEMIFEPYGIVASPLGKVNPSALYSFTKMSQTEASFL